MQLYKTEVFKLARHLDVPNEIIEKSPSAELWLEDDGELQSDERELGLSYELIDEILYYIITENWSVEHFEIMGFENTSVNKVFKQINKMKYKLELPIHPPIGILNNCVI